MTARSRSIPVWSHVMAVAILRERIPDGAWTLETVTVSEPL